MSKAKLVLRSAVLLCVLALPARADDIVVSQWGAAMSVAEYAVALDQGLLKAAGAPVTGIVAAQGGGSSVRAVIAANNAVGYGVVALSAAVAAIQRGEDLKIVAMGARSAADTVLIAKIDSPFKTLADLKDKSIGITNPLGWSDTFAALAVQKGGLPPAAVKRMALGSINGALTGLAKGTVDVAFMVEPVATMRRNEFRVLFDGRELPPMMQSVGVATKDAIRDKAPAIRAIVEARRQAVRSIKADPVKAAASMKKYYERIPLDVLETVVKSLAAANYWSDGELDIAAMDAMLNGMRFVGAFKGEVNWNDLIDRSFFPAAK